MSTRSRHTVRMLKLLKNKFVYFILAFAIIDCWLPVLSTPNMELIPYLVLCRHMSMNLCMFVYHLCASVSCHCSGCDRTHLWRNVMQPAVCCCGSNQLSVHTRVGNHSKRTRVRAGHSQRRAESRSYKTKHCLTQVGTFASDVRRPI